MKKFDFIFKRKRRTKLVSELFHSYSSYDHKIGTKCQVLVTEISHDSEYYVAHTKFYEQVKIKPFFNSYLNYF